MRPSVMGVARSLSQANLLQRFVTTVATGNGHDPAAFKLLPRGIRKKLNGQLKRREVPAFLNVPIETVEFPELINLAARRVRVSEVRRHQIWEWAEQSFDQTVARRWVGKSPCLYGCEHASAESFRQQKRAGGLNVLWQVIAHHKTLSRLLDEERHAFPQTITDYERELQATLPRINGRKDQQYTDADLIITNSEFARQTFIDAGVVSSKVRAIPPGCPPVVDRSLELNRNRPMIFLSAGSQSLRKGVAYLLKAWKKLRPVNAELWLVGQMQLPSELLKDLPASVVVRPPVSREELDHVFQQSSVLVLPTLGEGLAHIVLEALSAGLAIITTENSGCGDLVQDGVNGWKVPIRDSDAIAERIEWCIKNPDSVIAMQRGSQAKAAKWQEDDFAAEHARLITSFLVERGIEV